MRRLLVMMLMAMSLAAVAPAITASPASAAQARCNPSEAWGSPWWWGNLNARIRTGTTKVLAVEAPHGLGSDAYLWGYNGETGQKWVHDCVGYDSFRGLNNWKLRYAANTSLCLDIAGTWPTLDYCTTTQAMWQRVSIGGYTALRHANTPDSCLEPANRGTANGTWIDLNECHYGDSQLWF